MLSRKIFVTGDFPQSLSLARAIPATSDSKLRCEVVHLRILGEQEVKANDEGGTRRPMSRTARNGQGHFHRFHLTKLSRSLVLHLPHMLSSLVLHNFQERTAVAETIPPTKHNSCEMSFPPFALVTLHKRQ